MTPRVFLITTGFLFYFSVQATAQPYSPDDTALVRSYMEKAQQLAPHLPDSADHYYKKATAIAAALKNKKWLTACFGLHIKLLNKQAKFAEAFDLAQQHLAIAGQINDRSLLLQAYNEAANEYEYLGNFEPATEYYIKALQLAIAEGNARMQRKLNNNLASVFISLKDYITAYKYSTRAYEMAAEQQDTVTMGNCLINMGLSELHQQKNREALQHFNEAEKIGYRIPDITLVGDALSDEGLVYYTTHDLGRAERAYRQQWTLANQHDLPFQKLYAIFQLALVAKEKGDYPVAEKYASQAITIAEKLGTADELMEMYDTLAAIKRKTGQYQEAFYYKNKYEAINDSIRNEKVQTNIRLLNIQFRSAQKDKQIIQQNLNIERTQAAIERKNTWLFIFLAGILALGVILVLSLRSYRNKQKLHRQLLVTLQKQHEVDTLKARMQAREEERNRIGREMHDDIGSALTTILYMSEDLKTGNREKIAYCSNRIYDIANAVVDKMNEIIWSMNREYDTFDDLVAYTRKYAAQFLRDHHLEYNLDIPPTVPAMPLGGAQRRNIFLVIKEALHNVVKHAEATRVDICFRLEDELQISIHDNGKGIDAASTLGNGLKNMRQRMENIGGSFEVLGNGGTMVSVKLPLKTASLPEEI